MRRAITLCLLLATTLSLGACVCHPGRIGPYGGRPPGCRVW